MKIFQLQFNSKKIVQKMSLCSPKIVDAVVESFFPDFFLSIFTRFRFKAHDHEQLFAFGTKSNTNIFLSLLHSKSYSNINIFNKK